MKLKQIYIVNGTIPTTRHESQSIIQSFYETGEAIKEKTKFHQCLIIASGNLKSKLCAEILLDIIGNNSYRVCPSLDINSRYSSSDENKVKKTISKLIEHAQNCYYQYILFVSDDPEDNDIQKFIGQQYFPGIDIPEPDPNQVIQFDFSKTASDDQKITLFP